MTDAEVQQRVSQLIGELRELLGPRVDYCGDLDEETGAVPGAVVCSEWVLLMAWHDLDTGTPYVTAHCAAGMLRHHTLGLATQALEELL